MADLKIERVPIKIAYLGWFGMDHLHLALDYDPLGSPQDNWWVMEGLRDANGEITRLGVLGENGTTSLSAANGNKTGEALAAEIGLPAWRGSRSISLNGQELSAWLEMASYAADIEQQQFPYIGVSSPITALSTINSSSVIATLLYSIGIDITQHFPTTMRMSPGYETLLGTSGDDDITLQWQFRHAYGGAGDDVLKGQDGNVIPEKLYGGRGDDDFHSSSGVHYYNGGEYGLAYREDGTDAVFYKDIDVVSIGAMRSPREHRKADLELFHSSGYDQFYSIEEVYWDELSTTMLVGPGVSLFGNTLRFNMGGQSSLDNGDHIDFAGSDDELLINVDADGRLVIQAESQTDTTSGFWVEAAEWLTGSPVDDRIYTSAELRGVAGHDGNDLIDVRLSTAFEGASPRGYDVEISGGDGDDTVVAGSGRTIVAGGAGSDRFILSDVTDPGGQIVELVIEDAGSDDRAYLPIDLFNLTYGDFEGSPLFPLLGAMAQLPGEADFEDLPQNLGPWATGPAARSDYFAFEWQLQNEQHYGSDQTQGVIDFTGAIRYNRDGADLLIHLFLGDPEIVTEIGNDEQPWTHTINIFYPGTETIIRVVDFQEGDLGIIFHDPGVPDAIDISTDHGKYTVYDYPNWDAAVLAMTNGGSMLAPLDPRPEAPTFQPDEVDPAEPPQIISGTGGDDTIVATGVSVRIEAGAGNDTLTATSGNDVLDGGTGNDSMTGGAGNDVYLVESSGDTVVESASGGRDRVVAMDGYTLAVNVEDLSLSASATTGTGNALGNSLVGNELDNMLVGLGGNDQLVGATGDDILDGGLGSDSFIYTSGDGDDIIRDAGVAADDDALILDGFVAADVSLFRLSSAPGDLIVALSDASRIRIESFGGPDGGGIERILFADGQEWNKAELASRAAAAPTISNDQPLARDDFNYLASSGPVTIPAAELLANDRDPDGGTLSIVAVSNVSAGATVTILPDGNLLMTTASSFDGMVSFTYEISDGSGGSSSAIVEIGIIPNTPPVANGTLDPVSSPQGAPISFMVPSGLFTDADGDLLTYSAGMADGSPLPAWLSFDPATLTLSGTPPAALTGVLDIRFTAADAVAQASATLVLTIGTPNQGPVAAGDAVSTRESAPLSIAAAALLANDSDPDNDPLSIVSVQGAINGTAVIDGNGGVLFTPTAGFTGAASFSYTVSDGRGGTASASVGVTVTPNNAPVANGTLDPVSSPEAAPFSFTLPAGFFSDADLDALALSATMADGTPLPAWLTFDPATRTLGGTPPAGLNEYLAFRFTASDGLAEASATLQVTIGDPNDAPTAGGDSLSTQQHVPLLIAAAALLANDTDPDNDALSIASVQGAVNGTAALQPDGSILFTPTPGYVGAASFTYTASDGRGGTSTATVGVIVTAPPAGLNLVGTLFAETLTGGAGNDTIEGKAGNDILIGNAGDDRFLVNGGAELDTYNGGYGIDTIAGGSGNDNIGLLSGTASLTGIEAIDGGAGYDLIRLTSGGDLLDLTGITVANVEEIRGEAGNDIITGSSGADRINGGLGNDVLGGGAGDDDFLVSGDAGTDVFLGGEGFDRIVGSAGNDKIGIADGTQSLAGIEAIDGGAGFDIIRLSTGTDQLDLSAITLTGIEEIQGRAGNDHIIGSAGADTFKGGGGNDTLEGGDGNDTFVINAVGQDILYGGNGIDRVLGTAGDDTFRFMSVAGNLSGIELIEGNGGNDQVAMTGLDDALDLSGLSLVGFSKIDMLGGNDTVVASKSNDVIRGGNGNDTFVFRQGFGNDTISDFAKGTTSAPLADVIDLVDLAFADFADLMSHATQSGADTLITIDAATSLRLTGIAASSLQADDFRLI